MKVNARATNIAAGGEKRQNNGFKGDNAVVSAADIKQWLTKGLPGAEIEVSGDGQHFEATIKYAGFAGKNLLEQHRMVYEVLGDRMRQQIHALSLRTLVP
jgi:acid stress-induced BolA-like protein IbaG/YrbA